MIRVWVGPSIPRHRQFTPVSGFTVWGVPEQRFPPFLDAERPDIRVAVTAVTGVEADDVFSVTRGEVFQDVPVCLHLLFDQGVHFRV